MSCEQRCSTRGTAAREARRDARSAPFGTQLGGSREQLPLTDARLLLLPHPPGGHWKSLPDIFGTCRYSVLTPLPDNTDPIA